MVKAWTPSGIGPNMGRIVPTGWARIHRPIIKDFMQCQADVYRPAPETVDDIGTATKQWEKTHTGLPVLVQYDMTKAVPVDSGGKPVVISDYLARIPIGEGLLPKPGWRLVVTQSEDPNLVGTYTVIFDEAQTHVVDRSLRLKRSEAFKWG